MRIAYLLSRYPKLSQSFVTSEIRGLRKVGFEIHTFAIRPPTAEDLLDQEDQDEQARTVCLQASRAASAGAAAVFALRHPMGALRGLRFALQLVSSSVSLFKVSMYWVESLALCRYLSRAGLTHLHVHFANNAGAIALLSCRIDPRLSYSLTVHGPDEFTDAEALKLELKIKGARFVRAISLKGLGRLAELCPGETAKLRLVPCGIDLEKLPQKQTADGRSIICVARLEPQKGLRYAVEALSRLLSAGVEFKCLVIGEGLDRASLETQSARSNLGTRLRFLGALSHTETLKALAKADIFLLPSLAEGRPVALIEAMALGLAPVATDVDGIPELVTDERSALLVPPKDAAALAAALKKLLLDPELRMRLAERAACAANEFDLTQTSLNLKQLFAEHLGGANV